MIIILFRKLEAAKFYQNWLFFVYLEVFMRFYIMFGITFLICGYLLLFDPFAKYLGIFQNDFIHSILNSHLDCFQCFTVSKDIVVSICTVIYPGHMLNHRLPET